MCATGLQYVMCVNVCSEESIFAGLFRTRHERAVVCDYCLCETNLCMFVERAECTQLTQLKLKTSENTKGIKNTFEFSEFQTKLPKITAV